MPELAARELLAENEDLRETNQQLIAAMEEIQSLNVTLRSVNEALHTANVELRAELEHARARAGDLERMLNGIDGAAVLLNEALEIRDYNANASHFFTLSKQDIGRAIARVRHGLSDVDLLELCREALDVGEPVQRIARSSSGSTVALRVRELDVGAPAARLMLTVNELEDSDFGAPRLG